MKRYSFKRINKENGFALVDVLLAILILGVVSTLTLLYYRNQHNNQIINLTVSQILDAANKNDQFLRIGSNQTYSVSSSIYSTGNGIVNITNLSMSDCSQIYNKLKDKGTILNECTSNNNSLSFVQSDNYLNLFTGTQLSAVADTSAIVNPSINNLNTQAKLSVNLADMLVGNISGNSVNGSGSSYSSNNSLTGGTSGSISSGGIISLPTSSTTNPSQGTSSMACSYWLTQSQYQKSSLGTRLTPCDTNYQSTSNQSGERTWSCASLTSSNLPYSTDTWTGGSCGIICSTQLGNYPTKTQNVSCPTNYTGTITQEETSYCPNSIGYPTYTGWNTTSNTCVQTCSSKLGSYPTQTQNISCPNGYYGSQTQQRTSYCPNYTGDPTYGNWNTISSSCNLDCSAPGSSSNQQYQWVNRSESCPSGYSGSHTYQEQQVRTETISYTCPNVSSSPVSSTNYSGWSDTGLTQNDNNSCKLAVDNTLNGIQAYCTFGLNGYIQGFGSGQNTNYNSGCSQYSYVVLYSTQIKSIPNAGTGTNIFLTQWVVDLPSGYTAQWSGDCNGSGSTCWGNSASFQRYTVDPLNQYHSEHLHLISPYGLTRDIDMTSNMNPSGAALNCQRTPCRMIQAM